MTKSSSRSHDKRERATNNCSTQWHHLYVIHTMHRLYASEVTLTVNKSTVNDPISVYWQYKLLFIWCLHLNHVFMSISHFIYLLMLIYIVSNHLLLNTHFGQISRSGMISSLKMTPSCSKTNLYNLFYSNISQSVHVAVWLTQHNGGLDRGSTRLAQ